MSSLIWSGPSRFDGSPVSVFLTWQTDNRKTGPMAQSWILRSDMTPVEAIRSGGDAGICGACPRRGGHGCYVLTHHAPNNVWKSVVEVISVSEASRRLSGMKLRIGAYGDPAAVPASIWFALTRYTAGHTGYTHSPERAPALRELCMASVETELEAIRWQAHGWRTFRVRGVAERFRMAGEITCPASYEAGKKTACAFCLKCNGAQGRSQQNIVVSDHSGQVVLRHKRSLTVLREAR